MKLHLFSLLLAAPLSCTAQPIETGTAKWGRDPDEMTNKRTPLFPPHGKNAVEVMGAGK